MRELNKFNTALDLNSISEEDFENLESRLNMDIIGKYLIYNKLIKQYVCTRFLYGNDTIVDFKTFKQIHF